MEIIWQRPCSVQQVKSELVPHYKEIAYTTVLTVLVRLYEKGLIERSKIGRQYIYTAVKNKSSFVQEFVRQTMYQIVSKYGHDAITAFTSEAAALENNLIEKTEKK